jgi:MoaA/NifB/PqqE/SkfB family radical SAM enzyme
MSVTSTENLAAQRQMRSLPLLTLHLTERCNSRCVSCDYWRHGRDDVTVESIQRLLPSLTQLATNTVLVSGGEPLLHPQWMQIAELLKANGHHLWLLTSGLSLAKHATKVTELFETITVSLDGIDRQMYAAIRGLDAFDKVCEGIRVAAQAGACVSLRVTVQRANYRALPAFVTLAHELGVAQISFLAADVSNTHAFGRQDGFETGIALRADDLTELEDVLSAMQREHAEDFESHFIAESPRKMHRLLDYYSAVLGLGPFPPTRCNAPEYSAVIDAQGRVMPCFFIPGPPNAQVVADVGAVLNSEAMMMLRGDIRERRRAECATCVCSLWRDPDQLDAESFRLSARPRSQTHESAVRISDRQPSTLNRQRS